MSSALPSSQAPVVTTPASPAQPSATPSPSSTSPSQAATTAPQTTAAPSSSSTLAASSSSSSPSSSAAASSSTSDTSSSSTPARTSSTPSSRPSFTSSLSFVLQTSDGQVFTRTAVVTVPAGPPTETQSNRSSTPFFHNTGAVAGVFSVVGIIALVLIFVLLTSFVRRRRARKFDREIDEAAAAAAAAQAPDFDDFDYTSGTGVGYGGQYSETSHGTYNQPPLSHERSRNNLVDIPNSFDTHNNTGGSGAAGIGARGRSLRGGMQDPFGALTNPPEQYEMNESRRSWNQGTLRGGGGPEVTTYDMLQAAGLSSSDPYAVTRAPSTRLANLPMQSGVSGLTRSQSQGTSMLPTTAENYPMPTAAPAYPGGQDRPYPPEKARYSGLYRPAGDADAYGGYQDQPSPSMDNPYSPSVPASRTQDEHEDVAEQYEPSPYPHAREEAARASLADDEDYGYHIGNRVLRVANE